MSKIPFIFVVFYLITWIIIAPNPRFAFAGFALLSPLSIVFFFPNFAIGSTKFLSNFTKIVLAIVVIKLTIVNAFISNKLSFEIKNVPEPPTIKRIGFGRAPVDTIKENRCWTIKNCYFSDKDITILESTFGYKIYVQNK